MKTMTKLIAIFALLGASCFGQTILSSTTLGAAITTTGTTSLTLASTSTMLNRGGANQINTCLYLDRELFGVISVDSSTKVTVQARGASCGAVGAAGRPTLHANGATVYFANTATLGNVTIPAASYIGSNIQTISENNGSCTATAELVLPRIYLYSGNIYDCMGGHWVQVNAPGHPFLGSVVTPPAGVMTATGTIFLTDTGTSAVTGITVPNGWAPGMCLTIIPGGAFTWTTATNIRNSGTATAGKTLFACWDNAKWDMSY